MQEGIPHFFGHLIICSVTEIVQHLSSKLFVFGFARDQGTVTTSFDQMCYYNNSGSHRDQDEDIEWGDHVLVDAL